MAYVVFIFLLLEREFAREGTGELEVDVVAADDVSRTVDDAVEARGEERDEEEEGEGGGAELMTAGEELAVMRRGMGGGLVEDFSRRALKKETNTDCV